MAERGAISSLAVALRAGIAAGIAMVPFAAVFRGLGWRVNEYGRKTLELTLGVLDSPLRDLLMFAQHLVISVVVALPFVLVASGMPGCSRRVAAGILYGLGFYVVVNSFALPMAFGDPLPWTLGFTTVFPSLFIHLVYGLVLGWMMPGPD